MNEFAESAVTLFNVAKSCLGAGIYNYPQMFLLHGPMIALEMTFLSGLASLMGVYAYINLNRKFNKGNSISTLSNLIISPYFYYFEDLVVIIKCITVADVYMNLARSLISIIPINIGIDSIDSDQNIKANAIVFICSALLIPSILQPSLYRLKNFSYLIISSIFMLIIVSLIQTRGKMANVSNLSFNSGILKDIGPFVFGFTCHQSILNIHNKAKSTDKRLKFIIGIAFIIVGVLYYTFGFTNYRAFGDEPNLEKIFEAWVKNYSILAYVGAAIFSLSLIVSIPFQIHPAKTYPSDMFGLKYSARLTSVVAMMGLCYVLSVSSWYNMLFVSRYVTTSLNAFLCFGFPLIFTLLGKGKKSMFDYFKCLYLAIFTYICIARAFLRGKNKILANYTIQYCMY